MDEKETAGRVQEQEHEEPEAVHSGIELSQWDTRDVSERGSWMSVVLPNGEKTDMEILLTGADSKDFEKLQYARATKRINEQVKRGGKAKIKAAELYEDNLSALVRLTRNWRNFRLDGDLLECTPGNVRMVYDRFPWIREQVDDFVADRDNYLGNS